MPAIQRISVSVPDLERRGIRLSIENGKLVARPTGLLTPELRRQLATNLGAYVAHVCCRDSLPPAPHPRPAAEVRLRRRHPAPDRRGRGRVDG